MIIDLEKFLNENKNIDKVIINQFYGIGDILFIEPILRWLNGKGLEVIFPIQDQNIWIKENIDYVKFVKKSEFNIDYERFDYGLAVVDGQLQEDTLYLPTRFSEQIYQNRNHDDYTISRTCMTDKYRVLGLDINMWRDLRFKRNYEKEQNLKNIILDGIEGEYDFCNIFYGGIDPGSNNNIYHRIKEERPIVNMKIIDGFSLIDWCTIIEGATKVHTVSTSLLFVVHMIRNEKSKYYVYPRFPEEIDLYNIQEFLPEYWEPVNNNLDIFNFEKPHGEYPYGILKAEINYSNYIPDSYFPLTFKSINNIDNQVKWETNSMYFGYWSLFYSPQNTTSIIESSDGRIIDTWKWDVTKHGDTIHRKFWNWCQENKGSRGIAVGTHDGTTGEWVEPLMLGIIEAVLVEASDIQYKNLCDNYKDVKGCTLIQSLITTNGGEFDFYEDLSGDGQVNSVSKEHILKHTQNIKVTKKSSISLNDLIFQYGLKNDFKWLHLDVEGLDADLIMSLDESLVRLPDIIIYESLNLKDNKDKKVIEWLIDRGYSIIKTFLNTMAYK